MIKASPDKTIGPDRLQDHIHSFQKEVGQKSAWFMREQYIDRCNLDPFYILEFKTDVQETGDSLLDQDLFDTPVSGLRGVCITRANPGNPSANWQTVSNDKLQSRLKNFYDMYMEDYLRPPGNKPGMKGDIFGGKESHERLKQKRFLYKIRSESKGIIGLGPKIHAGMAPIGAICGQVTDTDGNPLSGVEIKLSTGKDHYTRTTIDGGLFWFSKVPKGKYSLTVKNRHCIIQILKHEEFGNIKGHLSDQDGYPLENIELHFKAPDGELFKGFSDPSGQFTTGPLPAFPIKDTPLSNYPYMVDISNFMFSVQKNLHLRDSTIGGILRDTKGFVLSGKTIRLKQRGSLVGETQTDHKGRFSFFELAGGRYELEVPEQSIYLSKIDSGRVEGSLPNESVTETRIELLANHKVVSRSRLSLNKHFSFEDIAPGSYKVRTVKSSQ